MSQPVAFMVLSLRFGFWIRDWCSFDFDFSRFRFGSEGRWEGVKDENSCCIDKKRVGVKKGS